MTLYILNHLQNIFLSISAIFGRSPPTRLNTAISRFFGNTFFQALVNMAEMKIGQKIVAPRSGFTYVSYQKKSHDHTIIIRRSP